METNSILQNNIRFAGYTIVCKLSAHHEGEREVYMATDPEGKKVILVVYDLARGLYRQDANREQDSGLIEEIKICTKLENPCFPRIVAHGVEYVGSRALGWCAQNYIEGKCLGDLLVERSKPFSVEDTFEFAKQLTIALHELSVLTNGGGHYNLRPENIIVDFDNDDLKGVHITGMTNAGQVYQGNPPFKGENLSNLYRAPETTKGIFSQKADVYSIGMIILMMLLVGKASRKMRNEHFFPQNREIGEEAIKNHKWRDPIEWNNLAWQLTDQFLPSKARIVLQKATSVGADVRFPTITKLFLYITLLEKKLSNQNQVSYQNEQSFVFDKLNLKMQDTIRPASKPAMTVISRSSSGKGLDEVAGMSDLKSVLRRNFVDIVKNSKMAQIYGITPPNGILLYGAPGCGKTFVAEKTAQESGLKYKIINPSDFGSIYIHGSQGKIAETFKEAEKDAPIILIFDEFDAIAPKRDADNSNQANEVNEILTQLNNCASKGIFVLATTNRPDMIDAACLRAGRMDEKFYVGLPDTEARKEIFAMELKKRPCDNDIDLDLLGSATTDFTCGDISYIVKETARRCFDEALRNGDGNAVPLTTEKLMDVAKNTIPSVSPKDLRLYAELKDKMEHRDKENKLRDRVGFSTGC